MPISLAAICLTILPNIGGILNSKINEKSRTGWYEKTVKKPSWRPPNRLFAPVWTSLYTAMGYASYLIYRDADETSKKLALGLYAAQLGLNWIWPPLFFQGRKFGLATIEISILWLAIAANIRVFYPINKTAAYLLVPYLGWVTFATYLMFTIWKLNRKQQIE